MSNWLTYTPSSGYGNGTITISASTLSELEDRVATLVAKSQTHSDLSATTVVTEKGIPPTSITFNSLTWVHDVYGNGGTASSANCSFVIYANYADGKTVDITSNAVVTGSVYVPASEEVTRHSAGTLTLTASYYNVSASSSVTIYQRGNFYNKYLTFNIISGGTIIWKATSNTNLKEIQYKINDGEWTSITSSTYGKQISVNTGDIVLFKGDNTSIYHNSFGNSSSLRVEIEGNVMSIFDSTGFATATTFEDVFLEGLFANNTSIISAENLVLPATTLTDYCYAGMFNNCTSLITAPSILPATTLANYCYDSMFRDCTSLTTAPELPATILEDACYWYMFYGCTSLSTAPELPATALTEYCYAYMFEDCTGLTSSPSILPANNLPNRCYFQMFNNCTSLITAPELPATAFGKECCHSMFYNCTSLTTVPSIGTSTAIMSDSACVYMFMNCTSLTTAPVLSATTLADYCYSNMFRGCTSLTTVPELPATTLEDYCYNDMFSGCTSLTTAPVLPATTLAEGCYYNMFEGCTGLTTAPVLPATTLTFSCYESMFYGCSSLTTAPVLPAPTLAQNCYNYMFENCSSLNYIKCLVTEDKLEEYDTFDWVRGVSRTGTFVKHPNATWRRDNNGIPTGWTVQNA